MSDLEKRIEVLEKENAEMKEILNSLHCRINNLLELGEKSLNTEIRNLEEAYDYEKHLRSVFDEIDTKGRP